MCPSGDSLAIRSRFDSRLIPCHLKSTLHNTQSLLFRPVALVCPIFSAIMILRYILIWTFSENYLFPNERLLIRAVCIHRPDFSGTEVPVRQEIIFLVCSGHISISLSLFSSSITESFQIGFRITRQNILKRSYRFVKQVAFEEGNQDTSNNFVPSFRCNGSPVSNHQRIGDKKW